MIRPRAPASLLIIALIGASVSAQAEIDTQSNCPRVTVSLVGEPGPQFKFKAIVTGTAPDEKLSYIWHAYSGHIVSGQGTNTITVEGFDVVTATVEVKGYAADCVTPTASATFSKGIPPQPVRTVGSFGTTSFSKVKLYLDKLAQELQDNPGTTAYIISSGKWTLSRRAIGYLVDGKKLDEARIFYVEKAKDGPVRVTMYLVPLGALPP